VVKSLQILIQQEFAQVEVLVKNLVSCRCCQVRMTCTTGNGSETLLSSSCMAFRKALEACVTVGEATVNAVSMASSGAN
jgi:hypothetical protein